MQKNPLDQQQTPMGAGDPKPAVDRPNDVGSVHIDAFVRIFDPETQEIFLETRA